MVGVSNPCLKSGAETLRNAYLAEKRRALDKWAMRLAEIVGEASEPAKVVQLR